MASFERDPHGLRRPFHDVVGVGQHADADELRMAYEQAMRHAVNSSDHRRALELSRAFDALPAATRARIYPSSNTSLPYAASGRRQGVRSGGTRIPRARAAWRRLLRQAE